LNIQLPELLYQEVIEIEERLNVEGEVLTPLNTNLAQQQLQILHQQGFRSIAIVLMHAWKYPVHELQLKFRGSKKAKLTQQPIELKRKKAS
jgi:5-oxoprolinase (ATP-hydrolysing)